MGMFGTFTYSAGSWTGTDSPTEPVLVIDVHDSDIATVDYRPAVDAAGRCYLGYQPRVYFEDPAASDPVDNDAEARGLARWARTATGRDVDPDDVLALLAPDDEDADPEDLFVEDTVRRLLELAGLPVPEELLPEE
ncbi:hypothetical protein [Modestobacter versicolor]|uniref:Uncharacterized protein n=1 Tax=Modestobacter versicolor TaxID=429133 RepID=A0A323VAH5_9ACTN|nr:hypothetical protein [Modestobacter versicolor]MBB3676001.1 hypothetical protein [Modestobacter versicolor]PZA21774.1 hypothetical protein DMO24_08595 [Modestobacter versicolor]